MPTVPFRLRIELPNRPGALAAVAAIIATHGGNVVSLNIHEVEGALAVDEIVVMLPTNWAPPELFVDLAKQDAGTLFSSTRSAPDADSILRVAMGNLTCSRRGP